MIVLSCGCKTGSLELKGKMKAKSVPEKGAEKNI
jgi:hypothetical protein